jgi:hypothetical protein
MFCHVSDQHGWTGLRGGLRRFLAISISRQWACSISIKCSDAADIRAARRSAASTCSTAGPRIAIATHLHN